MRDIPDRAIPFNHAMLLTMASLPHTFLYVEAKPIKTQSLFYNISFLPSSPKSVAYHFRNDAYGKSDHVII